MTDFHAAFDKPTAERMERYAQENATTAAVYRRLSLALLTKSSDELRAAVAETETAEAFLSNAECMREAIKWHEAQIKLLRTAEARIFAALADTSHDEMVRLLAVLLATYPEAVEAVEEGQPDAADHE
jgi:hypothetical protein